MAQDTLKYRPLKDELPLPLDFRAKATSQWSAWQSALASGFFGALVLWKVAVETSLLPALLAPSGGAIRWFPCPDSSKTLCTFFDVPLDHLDPSLDKRVSLAVRKFPATAPLTERRGALFINPGGPGGSGTEAVAREGPEISAILEGRYDIISYDPRGMLYQRDEERFGLRFEADRSASLHPSGSPISDAELAWAAKLDAHAVALDETCVLNGDHGVLSHASTAIGARDMRALMKALGEKTLNYWGFSYGTVLGVTFAAMFPDEVNRMVLDGVSDPEAYTNNFWDWGRAAMNHTHKTLDGFFASCSTAGPSRCALARPNQTASDLHDRISALRIKLHRHPLPVPSTSANLGAGIVTTSAVQHVIFRALYAPQRWPDLALALAELERGNGTRVYAMLNTGWILSMADPTANPFHRYMDYTGSGLIHHAIACSETDHAALADKSLPTLIKYMREMGEKSISGEAWALWITQCRHWSFTASEVYRGPWTRAKGLRKPRFPLLFLGVSADPATPLSATIKSAEGFGRDAASLLIQNGFGHCSYAQPSNCTARTVRSYFVDGIVPPWGTECDSDPALLFPSS